MDYDSFCAICTVVCACTITICATIYRVIRKGNNFMTQAEKARAYDEALERAKNIHKFSSDIAEIKRMEQIFPELKESEDEKIRKAISQCVEDMRGQFEKMYSVHHKDAIAWLEKQGKQPIYKTPSREIILAIWDLGNEWKELTNGSISTEYGTQLDYIQKHWQESEYYLKAKQSEQKPYGQRAECLDCQFNYAGECKGSCYIKQSEQKPAWSEEDEKRLWSCLNILQTKFCTETINTKWLKSLKNRLL